jgi:cytoplasmic iron level regulating protein YaaA (DUF328/UPF0246 family)
MKENSIKQKTLKNDSNEIWDGTLEDIIEEDFFSLIPSETLLIVPCTKDKIWDYDFETPDYVPARCAYKGRSFLSFLNWLEERKIESKGYFWIILSGKYGFIEPWHPISRYDVN